MEIKTVLFDEKYKPTYANETDFCKDLKVRLNKPKIIMPHKTEIINTGVKMSIPVGYGLIVVPRSSTGLKLNCMLANTIGIIDAGYRDEIKLLVHNFGNYSIELVDGQRIAQCFILPKIVFDNIEVPDNEDFRTGDRNGGLGSSGKF